MLKMIFSFAFLMLGFTAILFNKKIGVYLFNETVNSRLFVYNFFNDRQNIIITGLILIGFGIVLWFI